VIPFKSTSVALQNISQILDSEEITSVVSKLDLVSLNHILYRCKEEEGGIYSLPSFGDFVYAGLQGIASILDQVSINNDLGHPICANLRNGNWLMGNYGCVDLSVYYNLSFSTFIQYDFSHSQSISSHDLYQKRQRKNLDYTFKKCFRMLENYLAT